MESVTPSRADCVKRIGELFLHDSVNRVVRRSIKVASYDGREPWVGPVLSQSGKRRREFNSSKSVVLDVLTPTIKLVELHIGCCREKVEIHKVEFTAVEHFCFDKLSAVF